MGKERDRRMAEETEDEREEKERKRKGRKGEREKEQRLREEAKDEGKRRVIARDQTTINPQSFLVSSSTPNEKTPLIFKAPLVGSGAETHSRPCS